MIHWHVQSDPRGKETGDRGQKARLRSVAGFLPHAPCPLSSASCLLFPVPCLLILFSAFPTAAQPANPREPTNAAAPTTAGSSGTRWAFIVCGHPGDEAHQKQFTDSAGRIRKALTERFRFPAGNVWIRFGVDDKDKNSLEASRGPATKEGLASDAAELRKLVRADDELWVVVIGHAHAADRVVQLNLPGPDVAPGEFAGWFAGISCRRSVFFLTTPLSGYFVKLLAQPRRVVISATEPDLETNETLFPSSLAKLMETFPDGDKQDIDKDGVNSLLDLYLAVALDVAKRYSDEELLATEHAQLDDNGDGRGSELQAQYYAEDDAAAKPGPRAAKTRADADGALARSIDLGWIVQKASK